MTIESPEQCILEKPETWVPQDDTIRKLTLQACEKALKIDVNRPIHTWGSPYNSHNTNPWRHEYSRRAYCEEPNGNGYRHVSVEMGAEFVAWIKCHLDRIVIKCEIRADRSPDRDSAQLCPVTFLFREEFETWQEAANWHNSTLSAVCAALREAEKQS